MDWTKCPVVESDPEKLGGTPILKGSRMPADGIVDNYESGMSANEIAEVFELPAAGVRELLIYAVENDPALHQAAIGARAENVLCSAGSQRTGPDMETIGEHELGTRTAELLDRVSHGETFDIVKDGQTVGRLTPAQTFTDFLIDAGPRFDDLELMKRPSVPMRDLQL